MINLNEFSSTLVKLKRRKRTKDVRRNVKPPDIIKFHDMKGDKFRALALAMKFGCAMEEQSRKFTNPDIEIDHNYLGFLRNYCTGITRFRKLVDMIIKMIKVIRAFSKHASDTGRPVLVGRLTTTKPTKVPHHPSFFNPRVFSLGKYQHNVPLASRLILQRPWVSRSESDVKCVWAALRHLRQFRNMTSAMQHTVAKYARYERHEKNRTIVRKGDAGRHYYFIYSGCVVILNSTVETYENCPVLGAGQDFGHVALLHMEKRTATIMCTEDTEFIVLDRRGNGRAVYRALHREHKRKRKFLKKLELFDGLDEREYRGLSDHARMLEYLPLSLVATMDAKHPFIYVVMEGIANVALQTDLFSCCIHDKERRDMLIKYYSRRRCKHKPEPLHDTFTQHDPSVSIVIQRLTEYNIFGAQHFLHKCLKMPEVPSKMPEVPSKMPEVHLIAKTKLTVLSIPIFSVLHYTKPTAIILMQEKYPAYPPIHELMKRYLETSVWDLYKVHIVRDILHFDGRMDPTKRSKYCIPCQLRSLVLPNIIHDALREDASDLYCPGNISPIPLLACQTFRPNSAPPHIIEREKRNARIVRGNLRSLNASPIRALSQSPVHRLSSDFRYSSLSVTPDFIK